MLTGRLPFPGDVDQAVVYSIINVDPGPVRADRTDVPQDVEEILDRALVKDKNKRYPSMGDFLQDLERVRDQLVLGIKRRKFLKMRRKSRQKLLRIVVPAAIIVVAVVAVIVINKFRPITPEVYAERNSLAVLYFENLPDPRDETGTAAMITTIVTRGLGQSDYVTVVSEQRIYDVLKHMGREDDLRVDKRIASEVAERVGARMFVTGTVIQLEPNIVVSSEITERTTGKILSSAHVSSEPGETVMNLADRIKVEIGKSLSIPDEAKHDLSESVAKVSTSSDEAFRHYVKGEIQARKMYWEQAADEYAKALAIDSTFATVYAKLAHLQRLMCMEYGKCEPGVKRLMALAQKYSDKLTHLEKSYLDARSAFVDGDYALAEERFVNIANEYTDEKSAWLEAGGIARVWRARQEEAIRYYENAIAIDSTYGPAYGGLAFSFGLIGEFDRAFNAVNKYIALTPNEPQPYSCRATVYILQGSAEEAISDLEKAELLYPGFTDGALERAYSIHGDYALADSLYRKNVVSGEPYLRRNARRGLACMNIRQGKLNEAMRLLDDAIGAERLEGQTDFQKHGLKEMIYLAKGELDLARGELDVVNETTDFFPTSYWISYLCYRILAHQLDEVEESFEIIKTKVDELRPVYVWRYGWLGGYVELATGDPDSAITYLERAAHRVRRHQFWNELGVRYFLALALLDLDRLPEATQQLEALVRLEYTGDVEYTIWPVRARYLLGVVYERLGRTGEAIAMYEEFLDIWKDADPDIPEITDALRRVDRLRNL
jgi:tetratricopeptide (TPR) repeat protein